MSKTEQLYAIYDNAVNQYVNVFTAPSEDSAKRSFVMAYAIDDSFTGLFGKDFRLDYIGECDIQSGELLQAGSPYCVMTLTDGCRYVRASKGDYDAVPDAVQ